MIKAVVFDLDDTLTPEFEFIQSGYRHISILLSNKYNLNQNIIYKKLFDFYVEKPNKVFNEVLNYFNIDYHEQDIIQLINEYRYHTPRISLYDDVNDTINMLKANNLLTGIITDGYKISQHNKLNALKLRNIIDKIIVTDDLGREHWKPDPLPFQLMKEYLNVNYNEMIYIGDNPNKDFYISSIYPITTIRIFRDNGVYKSKDYLGNIKENFRINNLYELNKLLFNN